MLTKIRFMHQLVLRGYYQSVVLYCLKKKCRTGIVGINGLTGLLTRFFVYACSKHCVAWRLIKGENAIECCWKLVKKNNPGRLAPGVVKSI